MSDFVPHRDLAVGGRLGAYHLEAQLGEGATGVVYRARRADGTLVALKVLRRELSEDPGYLGRFQHEARAAGAIGHPHLVPIVEAATADGWHFIAAQYVAGRSLQAWLASEGPLPIADALRVTRHVATALDGLHAHGLVHRDVKPSNVLVDANDRALLTDFGLAKGPAYTVLTAPGQVMGTVDYLAPELIRGQPATPATDLYALGCLVYECLTGQPPFARRSMFQLARAHLEESPADPAAIRADLPAEMGRSVLLALEKDPSRRPQTATAYATLLRFAAAR